MVELIGWSVFVIIILLLATIAILSLYNTYKVIEAILNFLFDNVINRTFLFTRIKPVYRHFLSRRITYYQKLNQRNKRIFEGRTQRFIRMKNFEVRGELKKVTPEMKALIAACAIQITFGLPKIYLTRFNTIIVYPEVFYSTRLEEYHRGEVNSRGFIVLSWKNFLQGYANDRDGRNLGLHEMAHALKIADSINDDEGDFFDHDTFHQFIYHARIEMQRIVDGKESFFREYAATNDQEFFAVAVENFFERSEQFKFIHPELYQLMADLLNQDPTLLASGTLLQAQQVKKT